MMDFVFENANTFYFHVTRSAWIKRGNLATGQFEVVFLSPGGARIFDLLDVLPERGEISRRLPGPMRSAKILGRRLRPSLAQRPPPRLPDLMIAQLETGPLQRAANQADAVLPLRIRIKNRGRDLADRIQVDLFVHRPGDEVPKPVPFVLAGDKEPYPGLPDGLGFDQDISLAGFATLPLAETGSLEAHKMVLRAVVYACPEQRRSRQDCAVKDGRVTNNAREITLSLSAQ